MALPTYLNPAVGYALWWLTHPERGTATPSEIVERLMTVNGVEDRATARAVLRQAQADVTATRVINRATGAGSLKAACGYKCDDSTPIALRIRVDVVDGEGNIKENRSIVIQATAGENLQDVLTRARAAFNRRWRRGNARRNYSLRIDRDLTPADVDQVLINYTEGV